jgi:O-methyltransferase
MPYDRTMGLTVAPADLYLDLLKRVLTRTLFEEEVVPVQPDSRAKKAVLAPLAAAAGKAGIELVRRRQVDLAVREQGRDWPPDAETMVGLRRLENIQHAVRTVIDESIPGDWLETGVWRGGASIFARGCFEAYGDDTRTVWLADSFQGLPKPSLPQDKGDIHWSFDELAVGVETVRQNFARFNLLDDRVRFLVGWFADTLPDAPIERLAILRLDGDMYESTMDALTMYDKVSPGGYVIVDDYNAIPACKKAITDFRRDRRIDAPLVPIDYSAVYWRKR